MSKKYILVIILITVLSITSCAQKDIKQTAIAFYNCENFFDTRHDTGKDDEEFTPNGKFHYTERIYRQKLHNMATAIQRIGTDNIPDGAAIIGLAEIENGHVLNDLISQPELADRHYRYAWFDGPDERGIDVALLYNPKLFRILHAEPLHVLLNGTGGKETTRDVLHVAGILSGDTVHVFVNHWPSRRGEEGESVTKRAIAANVDKSNIESLLRINPGARIIIMGDFNDNPTDASITQVLGAKGNRNDIKVSGLYDPMMSLYTSGQGSLEYQHHWDLFDQIMLSGAFLKNDSHWHFNKAEIFNRDFLVDHYRKYDGYPHRSFAGTHWINGYSDHFPVIVYLSK